MKIDWNEETILTLGGLALAGVGPNLFPVAQAGFAKLSVLGRIVLIPTILCLLAVYIVARARGHRRLGNRLTAGAAAGALATVGLEVVRIASFRLGGMPGDLPRLMGVLLTDRFMVGPSLVSDVLGWAYHFWNGAAFGVLLGLGFLASPVVKSMGIGPFGLAMPAMPATVVVAHLVYGWLLGVLLRRWTHPELVPS